jgi:hypothetical protein
MEIPFKEYGFTTPSPPVLQTAWNEQKRVVDLSKKSYVFITSLYSSPWRQRECFPNADYSTIKYYWSKWADCRIKRSKHWSFAENNRFGGNGLTESSVFAPTIWDFKF